MKPSKSIQELIEEKNEERHLKLTRKIQIGDEFIYIDYTRTHVDEGSLKPIYDNMKGIEDKIDDMFTGKKINFTEDRKVLHTALRDKDLIRKLSGEFPDLELTKECTEIYKEFMSMKKFSDKFNNGELLGITGEKIDTVVNIGIGGSDLGPKMACHALNFYKKGNTKVYFISNIDGTDTKLVFDNIDPKKTLFIVVSKTFTTLETISNGNLALNMMKDALKLPEKDIAQHHFVAVSSNLDEVKKFGIKNVFGMWDYVGGRYSVWSTVGLILCLYIGFDNFLEFLKGASIMDEHFKSAKKNENIPILHAVIEIFYNHRLHYNNKCIVPYDQYLSTLPSYLQQAEMESNGKSITKNNEKVERTCFIIWGGTGTDAQHSFFQLSHQGTRETLYEFLMPLSPLNDYKCGNVSHHQMLISNCLAQSRALAIGKKSKTNLHRNFTGNRPSITMCYSKLTPKTLGALISLYEHKIFIQGIYWNINSFDQFGVELGKTMAKEILKDIEEKKHDDNDSATKEILDLVKILNK
ncbi:glucose-6-phosphate isomerase [Hamiltosporidium tvaerminnensis]|uniref:Glucose-6-phosphate isomerase n=1 Tax=Hamiltosporidium tvaerminnensis TaxID=1176355 RepID=A0A4Q9LTK2_9MICR|nr:glucose-6-phosphate isomerase [Hamiltosporidium tvaerminnensis]